MLTDSVLKLFCGCFGVKLTVRFQCEHQASAQRIEDKSVGYSMNDAAGDCANAGKRLEPVAGHGHA